MEPTYNDEPSFWSKLTNGFAELIEFIAVVGAISIIFRFFIAEPHRVSGHSMVPNFHNEDYIITNKLEARFGEPKRGEVIILHDPNSEKVFIKRVVGLPGERIKIADNRVNINGQPIEEPYLPPNTRTLGQRYLVEGVELLIPEGQYFVMGDNRLGSSDSREWGPVTKDKIIGQAFLRLWPPQSITVLQIGTSSTY